METRKAEVEAKMAVNASDYTRLQVLYEEQQQIETELETALERWVALAERAAQRS
ncbi:MAG: ABC transporter C-terminal domain-containing protein [Anaerolineales bacterium]